MFLSVLAAACATNPVSGKREISLMSEAQEIEIGQQMDAEVQREMGVYEDRALQEYVESIGLRLAQNSHRPNLPWHFTIVDVPAVNAFALPGGYVYLTRGILPYLADEAELAGVLGHEIGHVTARHSAQAYTKAAGTSLGMLFGGIFFPPIRPFGQLAESGLGLLFLKYGRDDELEADRLGAEYESRTGWNPEAVPAFLTTLARIDEVSDRRGIPNWLSTHPQPIDRVVKIRSTVDRLRTEDDPRQWIGGPDDYLKKIDGMVFGDNPEDGIVQGRSFVHPALHFALDFPSGWEINNGKDQVAAKEPGEKTFMLLQLVENSRGRTLDDIATRSMKKAGLREVSGSLTTINGLDAHLGRYDGQLDEMGHVLSSAAHVVNGTNVYLLAGFAQPDVFERVDSQFEDTIQSFRRLSRSEADRIQPNRLDLYVVRRGDTWQSIAQHAGADNVRASTLAIMNGHEVADQPSLGEHIKIVVGGDEMPAVPDRRRTDR